MKHPCYVQRIEAPQSVEVLSIIPWYSSGDRTPDNERAIKALNALLPLDYMGSAEFEFGAPGKALRAIAAKRSKLVKVDWEVTGRPVSRIFGNAPSHPAVKARVWAVCETEQEEPLKAFFALQAESKSGGWMKEPTYIREALFGEVIRAGNREGKGMVHRYNSVAAWLDLDNHWFASKDPEQFKAFCGMFEIDSK